MQLLYNFTVFSGCKLLSNISYFSVTLIRLLYFDREAAQPGKGMDLLLPDVRTRLAKTSRCKMLAC